MHIDLEDGKINDITVDKKMLIEALTHPSMGSIKPGISNFEKLEFVGDAVLDLLIAEWLYQNLEGSNVGVLSKIRSIFVQTDSLSEIGYQKQLDSLLIKDPKYVITKRDMEDCLEALFGAIYCSVGVKGTKKLFFDVFDEKLNEIFEIIKSENTEELLNKAICEKNPINILQEYTQQNKLSLPIYELVEKMGMDHNPTFLIKCTVRTKNTTYSAIGKGKNHKEAKRQAARKLLTQIGKIV